MVYTQRHQPLELPSPIRRSIFTLRHVSCKNTTLSFLILSYPCPLSNHIPLFRRFVWPHYKRLQVGQWHSTEMYHVYFQQLQSYSSWAPGTARTTGTIHVATAKIRELYEEDNRVAIFTFASMRGWWIGIEMVGLEFCVPVVIYLQTFASNSYYNEDHTWDM